MNKSNRRQYLLALACLLACFVLGERSTASPRQQSPSGIIVYVSKGNIHIISPDGSGHRRLTRSGRDAAPAWSRDGSMVALVRQNKDGYGRGSVYVIQADGTHEKRVASDKDGNCRTPLWSPVADELVYLRDWNRGQERGIDAEFWSPPGTPVRAAICLQRDPGVCGDYPGAICDWSPDGSELAIAQAGVAPTAAYAVDLRKPREEYRPKVLRMYEGVIRWTDFYTWHPTDARIRLVLERVSLEDRLHCSVVKEGDQGESKTLVDKLKREVREDGSLPRAHWSPDGDWIVYAKDGHIVLRDLRGGTSRNIAEGHSPQWSRK